MGNDFSSADLCWSQLWEASAPWFPQGMGWGLEDDSSPQRQRHAGEAEKRLGQLAL